MLSPSCHLRLNQDSSKNTQVERIADFEFGLDMSRFDGKRWCANL